MYSRPFVTASLLPMRYGAGAKNNGTNITNGSSAGKVKDKKQQLLALERSSSSSYFAFELNRKQSKNTIGGNNGSPAHRNGGLMHSSAAKRESTEIAENRKTEGDNSLGIRHNSVSNLSQPRRGKSRPVVKVDNAIESYSKEGIVSRHTMITSNIGQQNNISLKKTRAKKRPSNALFSKLAVGGQYKSGGLTETGTKTFSRKHSGVLPLTHHGSSGYLILQQSPKERNHEDRKFDFLNSSTQGHTLNQDSTIKQKSLNKEAGIVRAMSGTRNRQAHNMVQAILGPSASSMAIRPNQPILKPIARHRRSQLGGIDSKDEDDRTNSHDSGSPNVSKDFSMTLKTKMTQTLKKLDTFLTLKKQSDNERVQICESISRENGLLRDRVRLLERQINGATRSSINT